MEAIFGVVGAVLGVIIMIVSLKTLNHNKILAVNAYWENARDNDFIEARRIVYGLADGYDPRDITGDVGAKLAIVTNSYEQIGLLLRKNKLPFWLFPEGNTGRAVVNFYQILEPYIEFRRESAHSRLFAANFEYLRDRINEYNNTLPPWLFSKAITDQTAVNFYRISALYMEHQSRRRVHARLSAKNFEYLRNRINNYNNKQRKGDKNEIIS